MKAHNRGDRSVLFNALTALLVFISLSACDPRPTAGQLVPVAPPAEEIEEVRLLAATDRAPIGDESDTFGSERGTLSYEEFVIGVLPRPSGAGIIPEFVSHRNLAEDFISLERNHLDEAGFIRNLAVHGARDDTLLLFVHGYNYSYPEAVFRLAELSSSTGLRGTPLVFSWPSQARLRGYLADQDGAIYARDDLVHVLNMLTRTRPGTEIFVVGHSMGAWLVMESLRQLRLQGRADVLARLQVGLVAPDIDIDVFRAQMNVIGTLSSPILVLVARDDLALAVARGVSGGRPRLGRVDVDSPEARQLALETGASIVDMTNIPAADELHHDRFAELATLGSLHIARFFDRIRLTGVYILDASGSLLTAPLVLASQ